MGSTFLYQVCFRKLDSCRVELWLRCAESTSMYCFVLPLHRALQHNSVSFMADYAWETFSDNARTWPVWFEGFVTLCGKSWIFVQSICSAPKQTQKPWKTTEHQKTPAREKKNPTPPIKLSVYPSYDPIHFWKLLSILVKSGQTSRL